MALIEDFKKFAFKGNVVDMAVGVIIGGAFGKIVTKLVDDIIMPLVSLVLPSGDWRAADKVLRHAPDAKDNVSLKYGDFVGGIVDFLIVAIALFLLVSQILSRLSKKDAAPTTKECPFCLEMIPVHAKKCKACTSTVAEA